MQSMLLFSFVVFVTIAGSALGENNCTEPFFFRGDACCNMVGPTKENIQDGAQECMEKYIGSISRSNKSSRLTNETPMHKQGAYFKERLALACAGECVASKKGLLTANRKLDKAAIDRFFTPYAVVFGPAIVHAAIEKCFDSRATDVDSSLACKSGSHQFLECLYRECFLNCPDSRWTASPACEELKANVTKYSQVPVVMNAGREKRSFDTAFPKLRHISLDDFSVVKLKSNANKWSKVPVPQLQQLSLDEFSVGNVQKWIQISVPRPPSLGDLGMFLNNVTNMLNILFSIGG